MDSDVKRFESLYDVVLTQRQAKDIVAEFKGGGYFLPELQREFSYSVYQMSQVILSMLRGLSIDAISLVCQDENGSRFSICDGGHRVLTLLKFFDNEFALDFLKRDGADALGVKGKCFRELSLSDRQRLSSMQMTCALVYPRGFSAGEISSAELAVFRAKNSCATRLSPAVLRAMSAAASDTDARCARASFKRLAREVCRRLCLPDQVAAKIINSPCTSVAVLAAADLLTPSGLVTALTPDTCEAIAQFMVGRSAGFVRIKHAYPVLKIARDLSLALLWVTVPQLSRFDFDRLISAYREMCAVKSATWVKLCAAVESLIGKQTWPLTSGRYYLNPSKRKIILDKSA